MAIQVYILLLCLLVSCFSELGVLSDDSIEAEEVTLSTNARGTCNSKDQDCNFIAEEESQVDLERLVRLEGVEVIVHFEL
jgi:hypothetical protein